MTRAKYLKLTATVSLATLFLAAPAGAQSITFWTPEEQPDRVAIQEEMAAAFEAKSGIEVQVVPVSEKDLGKRVTAAYAAGELPDVVYHSLQYVLPWTEANILDIDANTEIVEALGPETFASRPLEIATVEDGYATVPVDGWTQLIVYRQDLFEENGLAPPSTFEAISAAIDALHNPPEMYGFVAATKVDETYMMQVLEHLMLANGYSPVNADGSINVDKQKLGEVLELYKKMADASPPGELYWKQARELYFAGKTAMIVWSPFILDELAGLRDSDPPTINDDPTSRELAENTGFITQVAGPSNPDGAGYADIRYMGVTADADLDASIEFVKFALDQGYGYILSIAPEGKFPVRRGDASDPERFVKEWAQKPVGVDRKAPLAEIYPQATIDEIVAGLDRGDRWGFKENQLARASKIVSSLVMNRLVREYIAGERSLDDTMAALETELNAIE